MRRVVGAVAVFGMLALSGCGGGDPLPTLPPTPSSTPVFASEEEALAAAEEAYAAYLDLWSIVASEGGQRPERLEALATGAFLDSELEGIQTFVDNGWHAVGASLLRSAELQYVDLDSIEGSEVVGAYLCVDLSGLDVVDASGFSVVSPSRPDIQAFEVRFDLLEAGSLVPSESAPWDLAEVCETL